MSDGTEEYKIFSLQAIYPNNGPCFRIKCSRLHHRRWLISTAGTNINNININKKCSFVQLKEFVLIIEPTVNSIIAPNYLVVNTVQAFSYELYIYSCISPATL